MREIHGDAKTIRALMKGVKYSIDYYQREYKWQDKQVRDLLDDLTGKFLEDYQPNHPRSKVGEYPHYFLGSIIISKKDSRNFIVDGQQRLTSLTLLLIYLRHRQQGVSKPVNVDELIHSEQYGQISFNLDVDERADCMAALFEARPFDPSNETESVQNIVRRYSEIDEYFPDEIDAHALPYFVDWLLDNVHIVEITAYSDDDAYTIFETMNDRGLSLSPTDMLKGYLLANITDTRKRISANHTWRDRIAELNEAGKETDSDFFKAWLRSQYADTIRERKKGAVPEAFDRIGTEFHRWLRDEHETLKLDQSDDFYQFIERNFNFYSRQYLRIVKASRELVTGLERILYNAHQSFTLQGILLLAPLSPDDSDAVALQKQRTVAHYVDILLARRLWNFHSIAYSTMQYAVFLLVREIRGKDPTTLARILYDHLRGEKETFASNHRYYVHQQNRRTLHRILARITDYVETQSGSPSHYLDYVIDSGRNRFEIEHIWANHPEQYVSEFKQAGDFDEYRNRIGGLLLLPKKFNASYGDLPYEEKLPHYNTQNLLARSLHSQCYQRNPGFLQFVERSGLPFKPHPQFRKADLDARGKLYRQIAQQIWNPDDLLKELKG